MEIFVKKVKRSLLHVYQDRRLNIQEFMTATKRIAFILNCRPIYASMGPTGGTDPDYLQMITPNMLLLGRTGQNLPPREYSDESNPRIRLAYISDLERLWWGQHKVQDFSSLVPTKKWM